MRRSRRKGNQTLMALMVIVLVAVILAGYWVFRGDREKALPPGRPPIADLPPKKTIPKPPPPSYPPDAPVLEQARKALREGVSPAEAVELADSLPDRPEKADAAFLLLEYAADSGNAEAALAVGRYYDPSDDRPSGSIQKNPLTAREWYERALAGGQGKAKKQLAKLREWAEEKSEKGSLEARELLNTWK